MFSLNNSCDGKYDSIDVRFSKACDNNCSFCIERKGLGPQGKTDPQALIKSTLDSQIRNVLILGGEPFLFVNELLEYIKGIRSHVYTIYITTSLPKTIDFKNEKIGKIFELVDGINISVQSIDWRENNQILKAQSQHNRIEILYQILNRYSSKVRINLNLIKGGIDSKEKLNESLDFLLKLGSKNIKLNEIQDNEDLYVSYEKMFGVKYKSPFSGGCQHRIDDYKGMSVTLKRSCFMVQESLDVSFFNIVKLVYKRLFYKYTNKFNVLYENGRVEDFWLESSLK